MYKFTGLAFAYFMYYVIVQIRHPLIPFGRPEACVIHSRAISRTKRRLGHSFYNAIKLTAAAFFVRHNKAASPSRCPLLGQCGAVKLQIVGI